MKYIYKSTIFILIASILFVINYPFNINKTFNTLEISTSDDKYVIDRKVTFKGKYYINIFSEDTFSGRIVVSGYEQTLNTDSMEDVNITQKCNGYSIIYQKRDKNNTLQGVYVFGKVSSKRFLKDVVIIVGDSYSKENVICIVTNVNNRNDALRQALKILDM